MGPTTIRLAAVLGFVVVFTTVDGSAVSSADSGGSRSPASHSRHDSRGDGDGQREHRRGDNQRGDDRRDGDRKPPGGYRDARGGGRRGGGDSRASGNGGKTAATTVSGRGTPTVAVAAPATASRVAAVAGAAESATPKVPTAPVSTGGGGSLPAAQTTAPLVVPRVTFGDGRSPKFVAVAPVELPKRVAERPALVVAVPSAPAPVSAPPSPVAPPPLVAMQRSPWPLSDIPVASVWGEAERGWPAGAPFGLAGLLLAPIAGAWLGYRQARASRAAAQLISQ